MIHLTTLVENTSKCGLPVEHGLSLYLDSAMHGRWLFDVGQGTLFAENAERLGIDVRTVEGCILSHGHYDHGGGLATFQKLNPQAPVYVQRHAFEPHYSLRADGRHAIGLDESLNGHPQLVFTDEVCRLASGFLLFSGVSGRQLVPPGNRLLFGPAPTEPDAFAHEQSLWIAEGEVRLLVAGCAHTGILNILQRAHELTGAWPTHVVAGMHLVKSGLSSDGEAAFIARLADGLRAVPDCRFYTLHCTGEEAYARLQAHLGDRIAYLSAGDSLELS